MLILSIITCILNTITVLHGAKILAVFPMPSISHQVVFRPITQELARRGHEVVVITTDPAFSKEKAPSNLTEIDIHDISYNFYHEYLKEALQDFEIGKESQWLEMLKITQKFITILEKQFKYEPVQKLINGKTHFDLLLLEAFVRPAIALSYIFKAPIIQVSSFGAMLDELDSVGASTHPILYPIPLRQRIINLSVWDKVREYYDYMQLIQFQKQSDQFYDKMMQGIFGPELPPMNELIKNVDMLFLNVHPIWMNNQPMPPNVVFMGGLHQKPMKDLPQELKLYLDASENGVVYVSFGTNVHPVMFTSDRLKIITEALSELPYDILFKWNNEELPGQSKNIRISKWLPQSDLLRHPNIKAFVMQGGLQSTDEAITAGVPLICIPMLGDQWYNAERYVSLNIGVKLNFLTLTKMQLQSAIENVITNNSYRENIVKLREQMNDQPQTPLERTIWWMEYVIRHGGARHLRTPAANMSWAEYYEVDLVLLALACLLISLGLVLYVVILVWRRVIVSRHIQDLKLKKA